MPNSHGQISLLAIAFAFTSTIALAQYQSAPPLNAAGNLTPTQIDKILERLQAALSNYVFPDIAVIFEKGIQSRRSEYETIRDPKVLADRLTNDMRAAGHDQHLALSFGEDLALEKQPTPEELQRSAAFDLANGHGIRGVRRLPGNIGYVDLAYFSPDPNTGIAIAAAMQLVSGTDALIIDLRQNGGGSSEAAFTFMSYFFGEQTQLTSSVLHANGKQFEKQHWTIPYLQGPRYLDKPLFILIGKHTHSAAELCAYDLKNTHRAVLVGEDTTGAGNASSGMVELGDGFLAFIPDAESRSPVTHTSWEGVGVKVDAIALPSETLEVAYRRALSEAKTTDSQELRDERARALSDTKAALLQEVNGFHFEQSTP
jgi:retinol-binding protein 3